MAKLRSAANLIALLILLETLMVVLGAFGLKQNNIGSIAIAAGTIYVSSIAIFYFALNNRQTIVPKETKIIETVKVKEIEKPVIKEVVKIQKPAKKSKYVGSNYEDSYHLRKCRFAGIIKKEYLVEKDKNDWFKSHKYKPCKVCKPNGN